MFWTIIVSGVVIVRKILAPFFQAQNPRPMPRWRLIWILYRCSLGWPLGWKTSGKLCTTVGSLSQGQPTWLIKLLGVYYIVCRVRYIHVFCWLQEVHGLCGCVRFYVLGCFFVNISQCVYQELDALWIRIGVPQNTRSWQMLKHGVLLTWKDANLKASMYSMKHMKL